MQKVLGEYVDLFHWVRYGRNERIIHKYKHYEQNQRRQNDWKIMIINMTYMKKAREIMREESRPETKRA